MIMQTFMDGEHKEYTLSILKFRMIFGYHDNVCKDRFYEIHMPSKFQLVFSSIDNDRRTWYTNDNWVFITSTF